jgi:pilus assembly protein CpaF
MDMLQAMNTGHDGSLTTLHANSPRDAIGRLETMCLMAGMDLPARAIRNQVVSAVDFIVQQSRLPGGLRKIVSVQEVVGLEGESVVMQEVFRFVRTGIAPDGKARGHFEPTGVVPEFVTNLREDKVDFPLELFAES